MASDTASSAARSRLRAQLRRALPFAVFVVLLACYWRTLAPTITGGDSGELATAVHVMGVAHYTGYPLYLMVGKLFDLLPLGEPAHRIALFSAVSAAAGGAIITWLLISLTSSGLAGLLGGLAVGLNSWVWLEANQVEVYGTSFLLISVLMLAFARWQTAPTSRNLNLLAFCSGLALTHHRTSMLFVAPMLIWAGAVASRAALPRWWHRPAKFFVLPLLLYLWLPFRSSQHPPVDWGNTGASLDFLLAHVSGKYYYGYAFHDSVANALRHGGILFAGLWRQFAIVGLVMAIVGAVSLARASRTRPLGMCLAISFGCVFLWATFYKVPDKDVFYMPAIIVVALWCGAGLNYVARWALASAVCARLVRGVPVVAAIIAVGLPLNMLAANWRRADRSQNYDYLDTATLMMAGVPANAYVLLQGDESNNGAWYYYYALGHRPVPKLIYVENAMREWYFPLVEQTNLRDAVDAARRQPPEYQAAALARGVRDAVDPGLPVYMTFQFRDDHAVAGWAQLRCLPISRLVAPPGVPEVADRPGERERLRLLDDCGGVLQVGLPTRVTRGEAFGITAAVRWTADDRQEGDLVFTFARANIADRVAASGAAGASPHLVDTRKVPVVFQAGLPPNRAGFHYQQQFYALLPRRLEPGEYQVFVQQTLDERATPLVAVRRIAVR